MKMKKMKKVSFQRKYEREDTSIRREEREDAPTGREEREDAPTEREEKEDAPIGGITERKGRGQIDPPLIYD